MNFIEISELTKRYPDATDFALRGVDLSIKPGEFFGLLGPNGCGKTTMISILCNMYQATTGSVTIDGLDSARDAAKIKQLIGLVPQDLALYPTLTLLENLQFFGHMYNIHRSALKERIDFCLEVAQLEKFAKKQTKTFSGGMKRRANLVVSLLHEPKLLLLDEPTVNVDPQSREVIFNILSTLNKRGVTMIYTTHYLEEAQQLCQRVAIMDQGQILTSQCPNDLIKSTPNARDLGDVFMALTGRHLRD